MAHSGFAGRWMTAGEEARFLKNLQQPQFEELRGILSDMRSAQPPRIQLPTSSRSTSTQPSFLPASTIAAFGVCAGGALAVSASVTWGIFAGKPSGRIGVFRTRSGGFHTNAGGSVMGVYMEVYPEEMFWGWATSRGIGGGEGFAASSFLIRTLTPTKEPLDDVKRIIGWGIGAGVGVGVLPLEWFFELGHTENIVDNEDFTVPKGTRSVIQRGRMQAYGRLSQSGSAPKIGVPSEGQALQVAQRLGQDVKAGIPQKPKGPVPRGPWR